MQQFNTWTISNATSSATTTGYALNWVPTSPSITISQAPTYQTQWIAKDDRIPDKLLPEKRSIELPDGARLEVDDQGNYRIEDKDAKVTYRANRMREFSPHLNASDMLAQFVKYVGLLGVRQKEVLGLPIELFISWLIIEAAERDKDPVPDDVKRIEHHPQIIEAQRPKCLACGRFIPRLYYRNRFPFCRPEHGVRYVGQIQHAAQA